VGRARWLVILPRTSVAGTGLAAEQRDDGVDVGSGDAAQVAEWAGHSTDVLLRVYVKCIAGQQGEAKRRIEDAMKPMEADEPGSPAQPADPEHPDAEHEGP
jgi:hypothetical protein